MPGPLQVIAVRFGPGADFQGRVLAEVDRLQGRGVLRLVDLLFVAKNEDGEIERLIVGGDNDFGELLSRIIPVGGAGLGVPAAGNRSPGLDPFDALAMAGSLAPGRRLRCCSSSTAGRSRSSGRSPRPVGRCWPRAS